jgi:hypothetical protein
MRPGVSRAVTRGSALAGTIIFMALVFGGIGTTAALASSSPYALDPALSLTTITSPRSITTDFYGDIYVSSPHGEEGHVDVYSSKGVFITDLATVGPKEEQLGSKDIVVDSEGNLYVFSAGEKVPGRVQVYAPSVPYEPLAGKIAYGNVPVVIFENGGAFRNSIAVTPSNDHFFLKRGAKIVVYSSAAEGNEVLEEFGEGVLNSSDGFGLAIDEAHNRVYAGNDGTICIFELKKPHTLLDTIEGADVPVGELTGDIAVAADEATGRFFLFDGSAKKRVYELEFDEKGKEAKYRSTLQVGGEDAEFPPFLDSEIGVDNGPFSPNSGFNLPAKAGYLFVPSEEKGAGRVLAFAPLTECPPEVESFSFANVTEEDSDLEAAINPCGVATKYMFEFTSQESFEAEGFANASLAGEGTIPVGLAGVDVSAAATGLAPETEYRFRVVATNVKGADEAEGDFTTYPGIAPSTPCPNDAMRIGLSSFLPDCRAYELVTPPDTNARSPRGLGPASAGGLYFTTRESSPDGGKVSFITEGGTIPSNEGTGSLAGDPYLATRGPDGWSTASAGPNGIVAVAPANGSTSPDQGYSFWSTNSSGGAVVDGKNTNYLRYPDGHSELVGRGSIGTNPAAAGRLISENGSHVLFESAVQLEPEAPPSDTTAVYDRTIDQGTGEEETHVVSLLPGNVTPSAGQNAEYEGASLDGRGVDFTIGKKLYLRFNDEETYEIGEGVTFAGIAEGGARIFYLKGSDLFAFDAKMGETIRFTESGNVAPVNVAADGTAAYFVSPSVLTGEEENPNGAKAQKGEENLYLSREGTISFVATVTKRDVEGELGETERTGGLGLWTTVVSGRLAEDPSRTTPDGNALLFESRADLVGYDSEGHAEVYRYDSTGEELECLSCNPTGAPATSDASLQSILQVLVGAEPFNSFVLVENLRADGKRAFFQSSEPLVQSDTDGLQDVYEWEAQGVGSCTRTGGCINLISSGQSHRIDYLYAVSDDGNDVFFRTSDLLLSVDTEETPSIYDARVEGGFPEPAEETCLGEGCRPAITPPPLISHSESRAQGEGNPPIKQCPKGRRKVTEKGKTRCVKKKHHKRKHHSAGSKKRAGK